MQHLDFYRSRNFILLIPSDIPLANPKRHRPEKKGMKCTLNMQTIRIPDADEPEEGRENFSLILYKLEDKRFFPFLLLSVFRDFGNSCTSALHGDARKDTVPGRYSDLLKRIAPKDLTASYENNCRGVFSSSMT